MCGRYTLPVSMKELQDAFDVLRIPDNLDFRASYNVPPTRFMPVVRLDERGQRELMLMRWGLIPVWAKDIKTVGMLNNARADILLVRSQYARDVIAVAFVETHFSQDRGRALNSGPRTHVH